MTAAINVTITTPGTGEISLQQRYLGVTPFVLFEWNDETEQFDIEAGGGLPDLDALKQVIGYMADALDAPRSSDETDDDSAEQQ
jgi:hypothetical protein